MASMDGSTLLLLLFLLLSAAVTAEAAADSTPFHRPSDCPTSCGSISVPYPFGTALDCAMPGFGLICDEEADPPKLFLHDSPIEVSDVSLAPVMDVRIEIAIMRADADSFNLSWAPPTGAPYVLTAAPGASNLTLTVVGCGAMAYLLDLESGKTIASCVTVCAAGDIMEAMEGAACSGVGCCQATFSSSVRSYSIRLARINRPIGRWAPASNIKAFVSDDQEAYTFSKVDLFAVDTVRNSQTARAILRWAITGALSCADLDKSRAGSACLSNNSLCSDTITSGLGYYCVCSLGYDGNPYIPGGCQASMTATPEVVSNSYHPKPDCPKSCGDITVPFPFGLAPGCYRDEGYHMKCSGKSLRFEGIAMNLFYVYEILLEEGQVRVYRAEKTLKEEGIKTSTGPYTFSGEWVMFDWMIAGDSSCKEAKTAADYACVSRNSECQTAPATANRSGYRCRCSAGYEGNPYVLDGCQDIDECTPDKNICSGICINYDGGYSCCPLGSQINSRHECISRRVQSQIIKIGVTVGVSSGCSLLLVLISAVLLNRRLKEMKLKRTKERYFRQNHGFLLQKLISADAANAEGTKIFSLEELERATNNFDAARILGHGGHGTVYKGILSDLRVVAIKKSKIAVERETDQFINEVVILSQVNHRNVVRLYGCCLETEVPLLVYEYITNGTLADHLHYSSSSLPWKDRLRIASEIAGALAYLHSAAIISIFHRDVKSSNILLDDAFTAKVSDFGASRCLPMHQTHITTGIQGTYGYLDPEYYHTGHLTEKSDVYSFGVILVELLTRMKPVSSTKFGEMNLAMYFNWVTEADFAIDILEDQVIAEGKEEEIEKVVSIAKECLRLRGAERPSMKEVEIRLLELTGRKKGMKMKKQNCCADHCGEEKDDAGQSLDTNLMGQANGNNTSRRHSMEEDFMLSLNYGR